jgi:hypothetical protein
MAIAILGPLLPDGQVFSFRSLSQQSVKRAKP